MRRFTVRFALLVLTAGLAAGACGDEGTKATPIRPFDEVRASDLVFERDPSDPSRAIFRVTTSEPMICAIIWGTTDSYGRFNNSVSMNGTGIRQHDVQLPEVEPGVVYKYIVQGTTADGTLYRSKPATFRIDATATTAPTAATSPGRNVAIGKSVVQVSSEFSASFAGAKAIDGDTTTEWATRGDGNGATITIDLGELTALKGAEFVTRSMTDGTATTTMFSVRIDGGAALGPFPAATLRVARPALFDARGRMVQFVVVSSSGGNVGAVELRLFA